jgi:hypothetical protein
MSRESDRHRERTGEVQTALVESSEGKRPSGKCRPRWENKIQMELQENGWGGID